MTSPFRIPLAMLLALLPLPGPLSAIEGSNHVFLTSQAAGWKTFEILSGNDPLGAKATEGFVWNPAIHAEWDGLGAYLHDSQTLRVFINQEVEPEGSITRLDLDPGALSEWIASGIANNTAGNQTLPAGDIVKAISRAWTSIGTGAGPVNSPCSGNLWPANTYGPGRGFADALYLAAEEISGFGHFWVLDLTTRTLHEVTDLGAGRWENAVPIDTGRADTIALAFSEDFKSGTNRLAPMRLYVGTKNPNGNFLQRNGLVGGKIYYWDPDGTTSTNATLSGLFAAGNGTAVSGSWVNTRATAGLFSNTEDLHPNPLADSPLFGLETVQACEGEGIFHVDFSQLTFVSGDLASNRSSQVTLLFEAGTQASTEVLSEMDNLVWATDGMVYVCEDGPTGDVWRIDIASLLASYATGDFTPDNSQILRILAADPNSESSGVIEISALLNYQPGSVFLVNGKSSSLSGNQLALFVSPNAAPLPLTYLTWAFSFPGSIGSPSDDPDHDGVNNLMEYACNLNPTLADAHPLIGGTSGTPALVPGTLRFEFLRRLNTPGLTVIPQFSTTLESLSWTTVENESSTPVSTSFERISLPSAPGFYRLKVTLDED